MTQSLLAVVAALDDEIRMVRSKMAVDERIHKRPALLLVGTLDRRPMLLVRAGVGKEAMEKAATFCLDTFRPSFILHVGYCGGADPTLVSGDLVLATRCVDAASGESFSPNAETVSEAYTLCEQLGLRVWKGGIATVDHVIADPYEKAFIGTQHEAVAIDMESAALVRVSHSRGVPYLVVRAVLDPLDMRLPDMSDMVDDDGTTRMTRAVRHIVQSPKDLWSLPKMMSIASKAREVMTTLIHAWLEKETT